MKHYIKILFTLMVVCTLLSMQAQAPVPIAQYSFSGNTSDQSNNRNNARVHGALLTQDRFGVANRAMSFDGKQSAVTAANSSALNTANATISFWVKVNMLPLQGESFLMSYGGWQERWKISLPPHGKPVFTTNSVGGIKDMDSDSAALPLGVWKQVVMTHDGVKNNIYIDGVLKNSITATGALNNTSQPLGIGYDPIDNTNYFNGALDEVMIFDVALTNAQVAALFALQNTGPMFGEGLSANYTFNGSGLDSSINMNHAQLSNVKATTDRFGYGYQAYEFNGTSSSMTAPNTSALNAPYSTISFWVKVKALPLNGESFLISNGGWQQRLKISLPGHGKPVFTTNNSSGISDMDAGEGNVLPIGVWTHVVMTHDGTNDKIFFNGIKKAEKAVTGTLQSTMSPLGIGFDPIDKGSYFNGSLDEIQIYNHALSEAEINTLYLAQSKFPGVVSDLVADFKLDGNGKDDSQFGNHAVGNISSASNRFNLGAHAARFEGSDSLMASNSVAYQSDNTTVSFWVKVKELPAQGEVFLLSHGGWQERWKISLPGHGKPVFTTNSVGGIKDMDTDSVPLPLNAWRHVAVVHDGATNKIFINGALKNSIVATGALNKTDRPLGIGFNPIDGGGNFIGDLDDLQIYNRALSGAEIDSLYGAQNQAPAATGPLVAYYPFSNNANDITPYANTAKIEGAVPGPDRFKKANKSYSFNNSKITAANSPQLNSPMTSVSFWVKVNQLPAQGEVYLLSHGGWQQRWKISLPGHGKPVFTTNATGGIKDMDSDSVPLPIGVWRHVVMTHDTVNDKIYINGLLKKSNPAPGALNSTTSPLGIGYDPIDVTNYFNGSLDEVQIYNVALSGDEVAALYLLQSAAPAEVDTIAPSVPLNLAASVAFTEVALSWLPSTDNLGVTGYNVYKSDTLMTSVSSTNALLKGLRANTKFQFGVSAFDAAGNESQKSTLEVTSGQEQSKDTIPPTDPTNLIADAGSNSVQLSWTASTDNRGVVAYVVLLDGVIIDTVLTPTVNKFVSGLKSNTAYTFEVYAYDAAGNNSGKAENTINTKNEVNTGEAGLVASYPFDDNANDATPYANHGVIGGNPTFIVHAGLGGKAIKFDGDKDSVFVKNAVQLISDYTTFSFWVRVDSINIINAESYIIDFGNYDQRLKISIPQHTKIVFTTNSKNAQFTNAISDMDSGDGNELVKGIWWYVTMVHDGTNDIIYVNGIEAKRKPAAGTLNSTALPLIFGNNGSNGGQYFNGALDNLKIYNKALTADEVKKLFTSGTTPTNDQSSAALLTVVKGLYPNPALSTLTVHHAFTGKEDVMVRVFDMLGRQVDAIHFVKNQMPAGYFSLNVGQYTPGNYLINFVRDGSSLGTMKFIKQ
ncbi:MAG: T9SS type A sorting domain-containing protein [Saprospiraceae bacterium]|nr:T9SS type A sorting domain-containing protein [Saprospiraceae bacterium]